MKTKLLRVPESKLYSVGTLLSNEDWEAFDQLREPCDAEFSRDALEAVFEQALVTYPDAKQYSELDAYLSPRVHLCIRIPRSLAADPGIWCWLAVAVCREYMRHRWPIGSDKNWWRYNSRDLLRNGIARLWWAAELVRDGPDYSLVPQALAKVRTFQNVSELRYSWHKECARAITRVLAKHNDVGDELGPLFNAYLKTQGLEVFDTDFGKQERQSWDPNWAAGHVEPHDVLVPFEELKQAGPKEGYSRVGVESALVEWLETLYSQVQDAHTSAPAG